MHVKGQRQRVGTGCCEKEIVEKEKEKLTYALNPCMHACRLIALHVTASWILVGQNNDIHCH